ncbi:rhomboid family intramembrane serine protease [Crocinitomix catalasitica]|uniref:rhomboid family intramembrane serine protease n=1 Tax=Crocinitomix catalasitica TaxID=184607 RepID=UPI001B7FFB58|nr:rhomboid family intramembrane serine protease [Crocinitomix catalasitica]
MLIINVIFFFATFVFQQQNISLINLLGLHYIDSPLFEPYQLVTHFFMHANFPHILFNMFAVVIFGNMLERIWGAKKFLIFYFVTALGAAVLHQFIQGLEVYSASGSWLPVFNGIFEIQGDMVQYPSTIKDFNSVWTTINIPTVGASGAVYGLIMAVALLFPNTEVYLYFAIPVKMKWLALGLAAIALFNGFQNNPGDSVAHFAHLGGMLFGFIMIKIWQRQRTDFY